jgi:hypothetical protein
MSSMQNELNTAYIRAIEAESTLSRAVHLGNSENTDDKTAALHSLCITINLAISGARDIADILIKRGTGGRELSLAITNLQQARQRTEESLAELKKEDAINDR